MKRVKGVFDTAEDMLKSKDSLVAAFFAKGGQVTRVKPSYQEIPVYDEVKVIAIPTEDE